MLPTQFSGTIIASADSTCVATWNQSDTYMCLDLVSFISLVNETITINPINSSAFIVSIITTQNYAVPVNLTFFSDNQTLIYSLNTVLNQSGTYNFTIPIPFSTKYIVWNGTVEFVSIPLSAVLIPAALLSPLVGVSLITDFFLSLIPVSIPMSFILRGDVRKGSILSLASLPFVYIISSYLSPAVQIISLLVSIVFVVSILLYFIGSQTSTAD